MIYFDSNANYPISSKVIAKYTDCLKFMNVSSYASHECMTITEGFHQKISSYYGGYSIIYTSGASESNSTTIFQFLGNTPKFICPTTSHPSVTLYLESLEKRGLANVVWIKPADNGHLSVSDFQRGLPADCVFVQSVDSETGVIHPVDAIKRAIGDTPLAVDDVQGFLKSKFRCQPDFITVSMHKIGAPIGFGLLLTKEPIAPMIYGTQNMGQRGGTINIAGLCASSLAIDLFKNNSLEDYFLKQLRSQIPIIKYSEMRGNLPDRYAIQFNGDGPKTGHVAFIGLAHRNEILCGKKIKATLIAAGILIGTGTACNANKSHTIGSMASSNIDEAAKKGFLRISFHQGITKTQVNILIKELLKLV